MSDLSGFRDYKTDDGEEYWTVNVVHALDAIQGELATWPRARLLNSTTGEIFEGPLYVLLDGMVRGIREGSDLRVEPAPKSTTNQAHERERDHAD